MYETQHATILMLLHSAVYPFLAALIVSVCLLADGYMLALSWLSGGFFIVGTQPDFIPTAWVSHRVKHRLLQHNAALAGYRFGN